MVSKDGKPRSRKPRAAAPPRKSARSGDRIESETQRLTWELLDDRIAEKRQTRLESLLVKSDVARRTYVFCVQLHVDLLYYFAEEHARKHPRAKKHFILRTTEFIKSLINGGNKKAAAGKS